MASWACWGELGVKKKKKSISSQRREDPPVGQSLEPEDRGEETFVDLGRLWPRWTVMTASSIESLCFYPQAEAKEDQTVPTLLRVYVLLLTEVLTDVCVLFSCTGPIYLSICAIFAPLWIMTHPWVKTFDWWTGHGHVPSTSPTGTNLLLLLP